MLPHIELRQPPLLCAVLGALLWALPVTVTAAAGAEYAIRWNARDGGPKTGEEVVVALGLRAPHASAFKVGYYDLPRATKVPAGFSAILRRREAVGGASEMTWKLRGDRPLQEWTCPLPAALNAKAEVDVTLGVGDVVARSYSYSCSSVQPEAAAVKLSATRKPCSANVSRWERAGLKVEEWRLPQDVRLIEVSRGGADTPADLAAFRAQVAAPLIAAGVVPSASSKTEFGSRCE